jgi:two-component system, LytTR family, response regulator
VSRVINPQPICSFLIVDDEKLSREYICDLIGEFQPGAGVHQASSVKGALPLLEHVRPDILFLDVKMPGLDGFTLLDLLPDKDFELVFITAYAEYAVQAFKEGACDYLLKPLKKSDFRQTLEKAVARRRNELERREYTSRNPAADCLDGKLAIHQQVGIKTVALSDIVYIKADNTYTTLHLLNGAKVVTSKPIHHFEKTLPRDCFFRIHKSHIINLYHFKEYTSRSSKMALMDNGDKLLVSRYRLNEFLQRIKAISKKGS